MEVYITDSQNVFMRSETIDPMGAIPRGSVMTPPPTLQAGQFARWLGNAWEVLSAYPPKPDTMVTDIATLTTQIDTETDALILVVIGERAGEYALAEKEATDYKTAGYPATPVPSSVSSWATAKGWTATVATDNIIATANAWRSASAKALNTVKAEWNTFLAALRVTLGV